MKKGKSPVQTVSAVCFNAEWMERGIEAAREGREENRVKYWSLTHIHHQALSSLDMQQCADGLESPASPLHHGLSQTQRVCQPPKAKLGEPDYWFLWLLFYS